MNLHIIAITHRNFDLSEIGLFHLSDEERGSVLQQVKKELELSEIMYLSTCNRVEFIFTSAQPLSGNFLAKFFSALPSRTFSISSKAVSSSEIFSGDEALTHIFSVASSLDSIVVGEREIITQVRNSFEESVKLGLSGDTIRLLINKTIETAKRVFTETAIAKNPVSVVSLAYRKLRDLNVKLDARFIVIGSGVTNTAMSRYLRKHGYSDFVVFNRTVENAAALANELNCEAYALTELPAYTNGFDVIVTCTASNGAIITPELYKTLNGTDTSRKVVIDLAVPNDLDESILNDFDVKLIAVNNLQEVAKNNLLEREKELEQCRNIIGEQIAEFHQELRQRQVEIAMSSVPKKVKEIRENALNTVFAKELAGLDSNSRKVLEEVIAYMEKKYISVPMKMAREILSEETKVN
ncbi:MAG TPA: glutamyl-tRNA reductase [Bacteroidia bacterium]|nr:glutamyl-tRNA reductase [Bacteroidia bacterium]